MSLGHGGQHGVRHGGEEAFRTSGRRTWLCEVVVLLTLVVYITG
jgi:hypothetical protein